MTTILAAAASGMLHQQIVIDTVAHNAANANTEGFRRVRPLAQGLPHTETLANAKLGVALTTLDRIFAPGTLRTQEGDLSFAIVDDAFFAVQLPDGRTAYTRAGLLRVDGSGNIVTPQGFLLVPPLALPEGARNAEIDARGVVTARTEEGSIEVGRISLARFRNPRGLVSLGEGLFVASPNSGEPVLGAPDEGPFAAIVPKAVEGSNVDLAEELTNLLVAQRAYSANARAFRIGDDMLALATKLTA